MKKCSVCELNVEEDVLFCPRCGHDFRFKYKYNYEKHHEQFDYESLNDKYDRFHKEIINEYNGVEEEEILRIIDTRNSHKVAFMWGMFSQLFTVVNIVNCIVGNFYDLFNILFVYCFVLCNGILLLLANILGSYAVKKNKKSIVDFELFYIAFFHFSNVFIFLFEYTRNSILMYAFVFIGSLALSYYFLKKRGSVLHMGKYIAIFLPIVSGLVPVVRVMALVFGMKSTKSASSFFSFLIDVMESACVFAMGVFLLVFIIDVIYEHKINRLK